MDRPRITRLRRRSCALSLGILLSLATQGASPAEAVGPVLLPPTLPGNIVRDTLTTPGHVQLPADDSAHDGYVLEYWQWWLHLQTADGRRFGASLVFFHFPVTSGLSTAGIGIRRTDVRMTDMSDDTFHFSSTYSSEPVRYMPDGFDLYAVKQRAKGGNGNDAVHLQVDGYVMDVAIKADRAPVLYFDGTGFFRTDPVETFRAYGRQRMATSGSLQKNGIARPVTGSTWFEHGWINMPTIATINWDYFQLQLADGRDIQLAYVRRVKGGPVAFYQGQIRDKHGTTTYLHKGDFEIIPTGTWSRDATCTYPSGWVIRIGKEQFTVTPTLKDQEVRNAVYGHFWDGETVITGNVPGIGIAEPLNYCVTPRPLPSLRS